MTSKLLDILIENLGVDATNKFKSSIAGMLCRNKTLWLLKLT